MKTALLFLSMNSWLIASDTFLLFMRPDNSIRLICNKHTLIHIMSLSFLFSRAKESKTNAEYLEG